MARFLKQQPFTTPAPHLVPSGQAEDTRLFSARYIESEVPETFNTRFTCQGYSVCTGRLQEREATAVSSPTNGTECIRGVTTAALASALLSTR